MAHYARWADRLRYEENIDMGVSIAWAHGGETRRRAEVYFRARAGLPDESEMMTAGAAVSPWSAPAEINSWDALKAWAPRRKKAD